MKQESVTSSCQVWGPFPGPGCVFEEADTLLQSKRQKRLSEACVCSPPRNPFPFVYNDPPWPRPPRSPICTATSWPSCPTVCSFLLSTLSSNHFHHITCSSTPSSNSTPTGMDHLSLHLDDDVCISAIFMLIATF